MSSSSPPQLIFCSSHPGNIKQKCPLALSLPAMVALIQTKIHKLKELEWWNHQIQMSALSYMPTFFFSARLYSKARFSYQISAKVMRREESSDSQTCEPRIWYINSQKKKIVKMRERERRIRSINLKWQMTKLQVGFLISWIFSWPFNLQFLFISPAMNLCVVTNYPEHTVLLVKICNNVNTLMCKLLENAFQKFWFTHIQKVLGYKYEILLAFRLLF